MSKHREEFVLCLGRLFSAGACLLQLLCLPFEFHHGPLDLRTRPVEGARQRFSVARMFLRDLKLALGGERFVLGAQRSGNQRQDALKGVNAARAAIPSNAEQHDAVASKGDGWHQRFWCGITKLAVVRTRLPRAPQKLPPRGAAGQALWQSWRGHKRFYSPIFDKDEQSNRTEVLRQFSSRSDPLRPVSDRRGEPENALIAHWVS